MPEPLRRGPFRAADAYRHGISPTMLTGRRFRRLFHDVYVCAETPDSVFLRCVAARLLLADDAVFSHETAAELRGLPVAPRAALQVTVPATSDRPQIQGIEAHESVDQHGPSDLVAVCGLPVLPSPRLFLQLASRLDLVELVVLGDAMVRRRLTTPEELVRLTTETRGRRGILRARRAARLVRPRVDSPMETRLRLLLVLSGLPEPVTGRDVLDHRGQWVSRPDLSYPTCRIAIEYDGDIHRTTKKTWRSDIFRRECMEGEDWAVIVCTADDVFLRPAITLQRVHARLLAAGHPDVPAQLSDEWRSYFGPMRLRTGSATRTS